MLMPTMVITVLVMVMVDIVHTAMDTDTTVHTATDTGEERRGMLRLSQLLPLTQMLRPMLMLGTVIMDTVLVMVDTTVHTAMDTDTIVHTATDTGEERRGMLRLSQLLPLTQMLKLMLMPTTDTMVLVMVMEDMEDTMVDTIVHTATDTGEERKGLLNQLLNPRLIPTMDTIEDTMAEDGAAMAATTDPMAMDTGEGSKRFSLLSWQGLL